MMNTELIEYRVAPHDASKASKQIFPHGAIAVVVNELGVIQHIENRNEKLFGYSHNYLINSPFVELVASSDQGLYLGAFLGSETREEIRLTLCHANGCFFPAKITARSFDANAYLKPQTATNPWQKDYDDQAFSGRAEKHAHFGTWHFDSASQNLTLSHGICKLLALEDKPELSPEKFLYYFGEQQNRVRAVLRRCLRRQADVSLEAQLTNKHQQHYWLKIYAEPEVLEGKAIGLRGSIEDISYRKRLQYKIGYFETCMTNLMSQSDDLILILDKRARIVAFNDLYQRAFQALFGKDLRKGESIEQLLSGFPIEQRIYQKLWGLILYREKIVMEMPLAQRHERLPVYKISLRQIKSKPGQLLGVSFVAKLGQPKSGGLFAVNHLARHDPLTGLYNQKEFQHQLARRCLSASQHNEARHSLLYADICEFSSLNQRLGAEAGDAILKQCARIMKRQLRERDTLARLGADEFGAILDNCDTERAVVIANQLRHSICSAGFSWHENKHPLDLQVGIVAITKQSDNAVSLLKLAQHTCMAAEGNNPPIRRYRFPSQTQSHSESNRYINIIRQALTKEGCLVLSYQPIYSLNAMVEGRFVELFSRLRASGNEVLTPSQFLSTAKQFDFMPDLDKRVLLETCLWLNRQNAKDRPGMLCSVNVSVDSLRSEEFVPFVESLVTEHEISPANLCLELSEDSFTEHANIVKQRCAALHSAGFKLLIDQVGSTSADARYFLDFDVDMVKLGGELTRDVASQPAKALVIDYIVRLAALKGIKTIASQLESKESVDEARRLGVHFGQGVEFAAPQLLSDVLVA